MTACDENHLPLDVGGGCKVHGGNCADPVVKDADLYVGFNAPMFTASARDIAFPIRDFGAPTDVAAFKVLVGQVSDFLRPARKVHAGCIGGHGRTGLFLAALVAHRRDLGIDGLAGITDPIGYVRQHYCAMGGREPRADRFSGGAFRLPGGATTRLSGLRVTRPWSTRAFACYGCEVRRPCRHRLFC